MVLWIQALPSDRSRDADNLYITVRKGDSLWDISRRNKVPVEALIDANQGS